MARPVAKGKKRRTEILDDESLANEQVEQIAKKVHRSEDADVVHHRDEIPTGQVVNILADEIAAVYEEYGGQIEESVARDKALILWRELHFKGHVTAREQTVAMKFCKEHRE